jgi:hypothetical protein
MNIFSSSYNPNGLRRWITVDGKDIEVDDLSVWFEGVDVTTITDPQGWAAETAANVMDVINTNRGDDEPEMTPEEANDMEATLVLWIKHYQQEQVEA